MTDQKLTRQEILGRKILVTSEVAAMLNIEEKTVTRYAREGRIPHFRTPGGSLRYYEDEIRPLVRLDMGHPAAG